MEKNVLTEEILVELLSKAPWMVEKGLELVEYQKKTPVGLINLLGRDSQGNYVIIEITRQTAYDKIVGRISLLIRAIVEEFQEDPSQIRTIVYCKRISPNLLIAAKMLPNLTLIEFGERERVKETDALIVTSKCMNCEFLLMYERGRFFEDTVKCPQCGMTNVFTNHSLKNHVKTEIFFQKITDKDGNAGELSVTKKIYRELGTTTYNLCLYGSEDSMGPGENEFSSKVELVDILNALVQKLEEI